MLQAEVNALRYAIASNRSGPWVDPARSANTLQSVPN